MNEMLPIEHTFTQQIEKIENHVGNNPCPSLHRLEGTESG